MSGIPYTFVPMTPVTKKLINDRWAAFRAKDWNKYNYLKLKVKKEIEHAKKLWANKSMSTTNGLWKLVSKHSKSGRMDPLSKLVADNGRRIIVC